MAPTVAERLRGFKRSYKDAHLMMVENFSTLIKHGVKYCESSVFKISGYKWKLVLKVKDGYISLSVEIQDTDSLPAKWFVEADLEFFVLVQAKTVSRIERCNEVCFRSPKSRLGKTDIMSVDMLLDERKGYYVNDSAIFAAKITGIAPYGPCNNGPRTVGTADCLKMIELNPPNGKFTWKIAKFSTFDQHKHFSHEFVVGQRKWRIMIYPNGSMEGFNSMDVFLAASDYLDGNSSKARTWAKFKLRVLDQLKYKHLEQQDDKWFGAPDVSFSWPLSIPLKDLRARSKGLLMNDMMYIQVEFQVVSATSYF